MRLLSVLAVIGKIIGFTLLGILGLLILILLIILFVPLRYKVDAKGGKYENGVAVDANGGASYLLRIISVKGGFLKRPKPGGEEETERAAEGMDTAPEDGHEGPEAEGVSVCAKLFGFQVYPKKEKKSKKKGKKDTTEDFDEAEILEVITAEEPKAEQLLIEGTSRQADPNQTAADSAGAQTPQAEEKPQAAEEPGPEPQEEEDWKDEISFADISDAAGEIPEGEPGEKEKKSLSEKIEGIRQKGEDLADKLEGLKAKAEKVLDFVQDNTTQEEFALILKRLGKALKHYIPKKFEGYTRVGLSDPATTGKILMYWYAIVYPRISDSFRLMGEFDEEVIEGDVHVKGRLRLNHIVWFGIRMLLDKRFRKLLKRGKRLMRELKGSGTEADDGEDDGEKDGKGSKKKKKGKKAKDRRADKDSSINKDDGIGQNDNKDDHETTKEEG